MKYDINDIIQMYKSKKNIDYLFFYGHTKNGDKITKACFSQWFNCEFTIDNVSYHTTEQYMMSQKALLFKDDEIYYKIMSASGPKAYKELGRQIKGFRNDIWNEHKYDIVVKGNYAKFSQNQELKEFLIETGKKVIVEASPYDKIWGIGMGADDEKIENPLMWKGQNLLGFALMEVRDMLIEDGK